MQNNTVADEDINLIFSKLFDNLLSSYKKEKVK